jgi:hypothetical protein
MLSDKNKKALVGVALAQTASDFSIIKDPDCAAVLCQTQISSHILAWLASLDPARLPKARVILRPDQVQSALVHICDMSQMPVCAERDAFIAHAQQLSDAFTQIMKAQYMRLRLDVISHNACSRFHIDALTARLICTYRGTGTQYGLANAAGDPKTIHAVPTGAAIVLRGKRWPSKAKVDLVHRSPPIQGTGQTRLVLVLDPIASLDEGSNGA